jgi:hypothetical protein
LERRYDAACAAALAGCGNGKDTAKLSGDERAAFRKQALDWLRADLVRGPEALAKLPEAERQSWQKLWSDVADLLKQAEGKPAPGS